MQLPPRKLLSVARLADTKKKIGRVLASLPVRVPISWAHIPDCRASFLFPPPSSCLFFLLSVRICSFSLNSILLSLTSLHADLFACCSTASSVVACTAFLYHHLELHHNAVFCLCTSHTFGAQHYYYYPFLYLSDSRTARLCFPLSPGGPVFDCISTKISTAK